MVLMKKEMTKLLLEYDLISEEEAEQLESLNEETITNSIKELGFNKTDNITKEKIEENLDTAVLGNEIYCFRKVFSTNNIAKFLANHGSPEGTVVISEIQTKARGRSGTKWESPEGGIWMSIILRPNLEPSKASLITLATGVAIANTIRKTGTNAKIKWPNDVLIGGKKVSGVLTEANITQNNLDYVVVGIGIDTNLNIEDLSDDLKEGATTLHDEMKMEKVNENIIIASFLKEFEEIYNLYLEQKIEAILKDWRDLSDTIGRYVEITQALGQKTIGYAVGINKEGSLIIEKADGTLEKIISGRLRAIE